jgi:hypothetical protein
MLMKGESLLKSDIEIAQEAKMLPINQITDKLGIPEDMVENYGKYKAKISLDLLDYIKDRPQGKYVVVTAITPTPLGEGKTTTCIGLGQAMGRLGSLHWGLFSALKAEQQAAGTPSAFPWRISTFTSPVILTPWRWPTTFSRRF